MCLMWHAFGCFYWAVRERRDRREIEETEEKRERRDIHTNSVCCVLCVRCMLCAVCCVLFAVCCLLCTIANHTPLSFSPSSPFLPLPPPSSLGVYRGRSRNERRVVGTSFTCRRPPLMGTGKNNLFTPMNIIVNPINKLFNTSFTCCSPPFYGRTVLHLRFLGDCNK